MAINTNALNAAVEQFGEDMELTHDWVQGGASETVTLGGVSTPTIRNVVKQMLSGGGAVGFQTKAALDANLNYGANTLAFVGNDSTASNNGWYIKSGASGSGSWVASDFDPAPGAKTVMSRGSHSTATVSDFNSVLEPGVYRISDYTDIQNMPVQVVGVLVVATGDTAISSGGTVQVYFSNGGRAWHRVKWGNAWKSWVEHPQTAMPVGRLFTSAEQISAPYDDFDTFPAGVYAASFHWNEAVDNCPEDISVGTLAVFSLTGEIENGTVQLLYGALNDSGKTAWRIRWRDAWGGWNISGNAGSKSEYGSVGLFETIGVIGDSFASGEIYVNGSGADYYSLSWGQIMARRNGISCTNFTKGGLTTRSWLTDAKGKALLLSESAKNLYLLVLGINDVGKLGTSYIGSSSDIAESYENNGDTFWGNYSRIISIIKEHAPNAKIIMSTMADDTGDSATFNNAIEGIATYWSIPLIKQTDDSFFTSSFYKNNKVSNHPTGIMYSGMAMAFERLISKCFVDNPSYFANYTG